MTTPTLREAADNLIVLDQCRMTPPDDVFRTSLKLAANTLRAIADAQSDAGKGFAEWYPEYAVPHWECDKSNVEEAYLAGHAQGAANLAAQSSTLEAKAQLWPTSDYYEMRDLLKEICFKRDIAVDIDLLEKAKELLE